MRTRRPSTAGPPDVVTTAVTVRASLGGVAAAPRPRRPPPPLTQEFWSARGQGAPPEGDPVVLNIVVGDPKAGEAYFAKTCTSCHTVKDMEGIATRTGDPMALQNYWVGGGGGRGGRGGRGGTPSQATATVTDASGQKFEGRLIRLDDFSVVIAPEQGMTRSFRRDGDVPKVEVRDPRQAHLKLLPSYTDKDIHDVTAYLVTFK